MILPHSPKRGPLPHLLWAVYIINDKSKNVQKSRIANIWATVLLCSSNVFSFLICEQSVAVIRAHQCSSELTKETILTFLSFPVPLSSYILSCLVLSKWPSSPSCVCECCYNLLKPRGPPLDEDPGGRLRLAWFWSLVVGFWQLEIAQLVHNSS